MTKTVSIVIPTYEMHGRGAEFLQFSFEIFIKQTFKDFDIVISDNAKDASIKNICEKYVDKLDIHYFQNKTVLRGNASANVNNGIRHATGKIIKILFMDDFLYNETSLQKMVDAFDMSKGSWLVAACMSTTDGINFFRPFVPRYHDKIHLERNTISSPSVVMVKNDKKIFFDENLIWYMDTDYYRRCHDAYGDPLILKDIAIVNRQSPFQITNTLANESVRQSEYRYVLQKYKVKYALFLFITYCTKRYYRQLKQVIKKFL